MIWRLVKARESPASMLRRPSHNFGQPQRESESSAPDLILRSLQEIKMGLCASRPSVAGSPEHYATHTIWSLSAIRRPKIRVVFI
ncbi:hypothetical protein E4A48_16445 [Xanthomonas cerealis pv. cerealis]|uniref:Uncharacterized protein n=1 Tax=Xanthomonas cerealis pv. cerealis TaxID=152263 RepID=A0A514EGB1_9XANT|nr:hypothetical protein E4A48_16445 [Xanthomonas translucens pv. cerealis]